MRQVSRAAQPPDTTPPVVTVPANMTIPATGPSGAQSRLVRDGGRRRRWARRGRLQSAKRRVLPHWHDDGDVPGERCCRQRRNRQLHGHGDRRRPEYLRQDLQQGLGRTSYYVVLEWANTGTGNSPLYSLSTLTFRTLTGTGTVTYSPQSLGPLPIEIPNFPAGGATSGCSGCKCRPRSSASRSRWEERTRTRLARSSSFSIDTDGDSIRRR